MFKAANTTIVTSGRFGAAVGRRVREHLAAGPPVESAGFDPAGLRFDRDPVVWASSCEQPARADALDAAARRLGRPWLAVVFEHPLIRIGPAVASTVRPCYACFARRRQQHTQLPEHLQALHALYDAGESPGPAGYLPHHVELAAAIAARQVKRLAEGRAEAGELVFADVLSGRLTVTRVVPVHACPRCGRRDRRNDTWEGFRELFEGPGREAESAHRVTS